MGRRADKRPLNRRRDLSPKRPAGFLVEAEDQDLVIVLPRIDCSSHGRVDLGMPVGRIWIVVGQCAFDPIQVPRQARVLSRGICFEFIEEPLPISPSVSVGLKGRGDAFGEEGASLAGARCRPKPAPSHLHLVPARKEVSIGMIFDLFWEPLSICLVNK